MGNDINRAEHYVASEIYDEGKHILKNIKDTAKLVHTGLNYLGDGLERFGVKVKKEWLEEMHQLALSSAGLAEKVEFLERKLNDVTGGSGSIILATLLPEVEIADSLIEIAPDLLSGKIPSREKLMRVAGDMIGSYVIKEDIKLLEVAATELKNASFMERIMATETGRRVFAKVEEKAQSLMKKYLIDQGSALAVDVGTEIKKSLMANNANTIQGIPQHQMPSGMPSGMHSGMVGLMPIGQTQRMGMPRIAENQPGLMLLPPQAQPMLGQGMVRSTAMY